MSSQAIASPEEIERFAQNLKQFNSMLGSNLARLNSQFNALGETWRDQEHIKFAQEFRETAKVIERFMRSAEEQTPYLMRKAQRLRDYLNQR